MKSGWQRKPVGEILQLEYGKPLNDAERTPDGRYPVYGANGEKDRTNKSYFNKRSIIVGRKGSAGEVNLTEPKFWPLDVTYFVTYDDQQFDLQFLYHLLKNLDLPQLAKGVKPGINRNDVYSLVASVPPLREQQRIVRVLETAVHNLTTAYESAEKNLQNAKLLFKSHLQFVFTQRTKGWVATTIGQHIRFIDYRGKTPTKTESGIRLITAKNVKMGYLQDTPREFVAPSSYKTWMTRGIPRVGDVLFTTEAPLANVAQLDIGEKVVFAQRIIVMQPDPAKLHNAFLKYLLLSEPVQRRIHAKGTGATVKGIKASLLRTVEISFPEQISAQKAIAGELDVLHEETERLQSVYQKKLGALKLLEGSLRRHALVGNL